MSLTFLKFPLEASWWAQPGSQSVLDKTDVSAPSTV
jgi:hypothetical protein